MKKTIQFAISTIAVIACCACSTPTEEPLKLWYDAPAKQWVEALPIGNGRLGAMVYGDPIHEELQLNEETVWGGSPHNNVNPLAKDHLDEIRSLIFEGKNAQAQELCGKYISAQQANGMPYQTVGSLKLHFIGIDSVSNYYRELDITNAIATTTFTADGTDYRRESFASLTDDVIIVRLTASKKGAISFEAHYDSPMPHETPTANADKQTLTLRGRGTNHEGIEGKIKYTSIARFEHKGGSLSSQADAMKITDADEVIIYLSMGTNFVNYKDVSGNADQRAEAPLANIETDYHKAKDAHSARYRSYFDRVSLDLGTTPAALLQTDKRVELFKEGNDPRLIELYFQFGRYLLICCSQPGGQAANLQGIWNDKTKAPWDGKYTANINLEMNYWPAEVTNLSELHEPMLRLVREVADKGRETAAMYGCRGWTMHHNTDIWRSTGAVDGPSYGIWPTCNAWLCQHLYEHYLFTGDEAFLREVYPIMKSACEFYIDFLVPEPKNGWLVVSPSFSPENRPNVNGKRSFSVVAGATMDNQMVRDLLRNTTEAATLLGEDIAFVDTLRTIEARLAPMQIGRWGQLQEWMEDWDNPKDHHRHVSHLWGLYPGNQITENTPELFEAAKQSLIARGDPSTGWSMGWKVCLWARLLDGNHAMKLIREQIKPAVGESGQNGGTYPNLFDAHPPFQIDGNFGCTAGIADMLVQSHAGYIHLLPALPDEWDQGTVKGLCCRGGFELTELTWENGTVISATLLSRLGGRLRIKVNGEMKEIDTQKGETIQLN